MTSTQSLVDEKSTRTSPKALGGDDEQASSELLVFSTASDAGTEKGPRESCSPSIVTNSVTGSGTDKPAIAPPAPDTGNEGVRSEHMANDDNQSHEGPPDDYPSGARLGFIVVALVLSIFLMSLDLTIVATAIPKITSEFHGLDDVSWYSSAFFMTMGGFQSVWY